MIDVDYPPLIFGLLILLVLIAPAWYGAALVDKYWAKNKAEEAAKAVHEDDVFN